MILAQKIAYNVAFNTVTKILSTVLALVSIGFITRYLGRDGFGDYATVLAFFSFFSAMLDLGLYSVATREISRKNADEKKIMGNVFALRIVASSLVVIIAPILVFFLPYSQEVKTGILLVAVAYMMASSYMVLNGIFQKNLRMDKVAITELFGKAIQVAFIIIAVRNNWGFTAIILSLLINMVFAFVVVLFLSRRYVKFLPIFDFVYWKKFLKMSFPMGASALITFLYFKMDTILLSLLKGSEEVGIYNMAYKILENITFFPAMIVGLVLPLFSMYIFSNKKSFRKIADKTYKVFFLIVIPLIVGVLFLAEDIIYIIGGNDFLISANVLRILVFALAFIFYGNFFNSILLSANLQKMLMKILTVCAVFNITLNLILIPKFSYMGAAGVSVVTEMLVVLLTAYFTAKKVNYTPSIKGFGRIIFSGLVMTVFLYLFKNNGFIFLAGGSSLVYVIFLWLSQAVTLKEIRVLMPASLNK